MAKVKGKKVSRRGKKLAKKTPAKRGRGRGRPFKPGNPGGPGRPRKGASAADFVESAISAEELCTLAARQARRGSITALRLLFEYRFGKPWTESELQMLREEQEARARIAAARKRKVNDGIPEEAAAARVESGGGPDESET